MRSVTRRPCSRRVAIPSGSTPRQLSDVLELRDLIVAGRLEEAAAVAHADLAPGVEEEWLDEVRDSHRLRLDELYESLAADGGSRR